MEIVKIIKIDEDSVVKYGSKELRGSDLLKVMKDNSRSNTYKFKYALPESHATVNQEHKFIHSRLNNHRCVVGRFDRALVVGGSLVSYGYYVVLDPTLEYLYPVTPSELNQMSNANVKVYDSIEIL